MKFRLLCGADFHILEEEACDLAINCLKTGIDKYKPDIVAVLGDFFHNRPSLEKMGAKLHQSFLDLHDEWIFLFGNHDGMPRIDGSLRVGWDLFESIFGSAQAVHEFGGRRFVKLGYEKISNWREFALAEASEGSIILSHAPLEDDMLIAVAGKGASLALSGHDHAASHRVVGECEQYVLAPFQFGGRDGDTAGFCIVDFTDQGFTFQWVPQTLPRMPGGTRIVSTRQIHTTRREETDSLAEWCRYIPCIKEDYQWFGGAPRLQCYQKKELIWEKEYGSGILNSCTPLFVTHDDKDFLVIGGTWVMAGEPTEETFGCFASLVVVDPYTGKEHYRIPVSGVVQPPAVEDGMMYIAGTEREVIAVELETGYELWRTKSEVETEATRDLCWMGIFTGGGWSVCAPALGRHLWVVNARGDLFGYDKSTGNARFVHPAAIPVNDIPCCPYANRLAVVAEQFDMETSGEEIIFTVNGQGVNDTTGQLIPA
jgi:hypothetical protein